MAYQYGATKTPNNRALEQITHWRSRAEVAEARLQEAAKDLDAAKRSARKYKSLFEKGNVETRQAVADEMNKLYAKIQELEADNAAKDRRVAHLERRARTGTVPRDPEGTKRLRAAVAEIDAFNNRKWTKNLKETA